MQNICVVIVPLNYPFFLHSLNLFTIAYLASASDYITENMYSWSINDTLIMTTTSKIRIAPSTRILDSELEVINYTLLRYDFKTSDI